jgi:Ca2+-binding RTX toxin-like protein
MSNFTGSSGLDVYYGQGEAETISGLGGPDYLFGGGGDDVISGGDGDDTLYGEAGADKLDGGAGDDRLIADAQMISFDYDRASDTLTGGAGADRFVFEFGFSDKAGNLAVYDHITDFSQAAGDRLELHYSGYQSKPMAWVGAVTAPDFALSPNHAFTAQPLDPAYRGVYTWVNGGVTYLMIDVNANGTLDEPDFVLALDGASTLDRNAFPPNLDAADVMVFVGTPGNDTWTGYDAAADTYHGLAGDDVAYGLGGDDELHGEAGDDTLDGGDGGDRLLGYDGNDVLHGGGGDDVLYAGGQYNGGSDYGTINRLYGDDGADVLIASDGQDFLYGGAGDDRLNGGGGDVLEGGDGADVLAIGNGTANGGAGDDTFSAANSVLTGGAGADHYSISMGYSGSDLFYNTITDFDVAQGDRIDVDARTYYSFPFVWRGALDNAQFTLDAGKTFSSDDYGPGFTQFWTWINGGYTYLIIDNNGSGALDSQDYVLRFTGAVALDPSIFSGSIFATNLGGTPDADVFTGGAGVDTYYALNGDDQAHGGDGADVLYGNNGQDELWGDAGGDTLNGGMGDDHLHGGAGDDKLIGGAGSDVIDGGDGNDVIATGGSSLGEPDDSTAVNTVYGGAGDDQISGAVTRDILHGGDGKDSIYGMGALYGDAGDDTLSLADGYFGGVPPGGRIEGGAGDDFLRGGYGADVLYGDAGKDGLQGGGGDDVIHADLGDGAVNGADGADLIFVDGLPSGDALPTDTLWLYGGDYYDGDDVFRILVDLSARSQIYLSGGGGSDTVDLSAAAGAVQVDLSRFDAQQTGMGNFSFNAVENVIGGDHGSTLTGDASINALTGGAGIDTLAGGAGDDILEGLAGGDVLNGGAGVDRVTYAAATAGLRISLADPSVNTGDAAGDTYQSIESVVGSSFADVITGDAADNLIQGGGGGDNLTGGAGADTFKYTAYSDATQAVYDIIADFQTGVDKIDLMALRPSYVSMVHTQGATYFFPWASDGVMLIAAAGNVQASDLMTWAATNYYIVGDDSGMTLTGGAYEDSIVGGAGDDLLSGGTSGDALYGGAGANTFAYASAAESNTYALDIIHDFKTGVDKLNLTALAPSNVSIIHYDGGTFVSGESADGEFVIASMHDIGVSDIVGLSGGVRLIGEDVADTIAGGAANDTIIGGGAGDALFGGAGADTFVYRSATESNPNAGRLDIIHDFQTGMDVLDLSALNPANVSVLHYQGGTFVAGNSASGVFQIASVHDINATDIVGLTSGAYIVGDELANTLLGGALSETIVGSDGNDIIIGGGAADALFGGTGADTFKFTAKDDSVPGAPDITHDFQTGVDKIDLTALHTHGANDHYTLVSDANTSYLFVQLDGNTGNDMLILFTTPNVQASDILW